MELHHSLWEVFEITFMIGAGFTTGSCIIAGVVGAISGFFD